MSHIAQTAASLFFWRCSGRRQRRAPRDHSLIAATFAYLATKCPPYVGPTHSIHPPRPLRSRFAVETKMLPGSPESTAGGTRATGAVRVAGMRGSDASSTTGPDFGRWEFADRLAEEVVRRKYVYRSVEILPARRGSRDEFWTVQRGRFAHPLFSSSSGAMHRAPNCATLQPGSSTFPLLLVSGLRYGE